MLLKLKKALQQPHSRGLLLAGFLSAVLAVIVSRILRSVGHDTYVFSTVCVFLAALFLAGLLFGVSGYGSEKNIKRKHPHYDQIKKIETVILTFRNNVQQNPDILLDDSLTLGNAETKIDKMLNTFYHGFNNTDTMWYIESVFKRSDCKSLLNKLDRINQDPLLLNEFNTTKEILKEIWLEPLLEESETLNQMLHSETYLVNTLLALDNLTRSKRQELEKRQVEQKRAKNELSDMMT